MLSYMFRTKKIKHKLYNESVKHHMKKIKNTWCDTFISLCFMDFIYLSFSWNTIASYMFKTKEDN
jgi:hypothetical protein